MKFIEIRTILGVADNKTHSLNTIQETLNIDEISRFSPSSNHQYFDNPVTIIELKNGSKIEILYSYNNLKKLFHQSALYL